MTIANNICLIAKSIYTCCQMLCRDLYPHYKNGPRFFDYGKLKIFLVLRRKSLWCGYESVARLTLLPAELLLVSCYFSVPAPARAELLPGGSCVSPVSTETRHIEHLKTSHIARQLFMRDKLLSS